jgi:hypothetical protein
VVGPATGNVPHDGDDRRVIDGATLEIDGEAVFGTVLDFGCVAGIADATAVALFSAVARVAVGGRAVAVFGGTARVAVFGGTGRGLALFGGTGRGLAVLAGAVLTAVGSACGRREDVRTRRLTSANISWNNWRILSIFHSRLTFGIRSHPL